LKESNVSTLRQGVELALTNQSVSIADVIRNGGKQMIQLHITSALATYLSLIPASRGLSNDSILAIGELFTDHPEIKHITIDELKLFLTFAFKQQKYGKLYGGFGYDTLLEWWNEYFEDRTKEVIKYRENEHTTQTTFEKGRRDRTVDAFGIKTIKDISDGEKENS
jgi:hypothetical protein